MYEVTLNVLSTKAVHFSLNRTQAGNGFLSRSFPQNIILSLLYNKVYTRRCHFQNFNFQSI